MLLDSTLSLQTGTQGFGWQQIYFLIGGTALFLLGIQMTSDGLRRAAGGRMRTLFAAVGRNKIAGVGAGFGITAMLQSSSASTVVLVGLADAGLLTAIQSAPMILGAGLGTTLVPQILAFKIAKWGLIPVAIGFVMRIFARWEAWRGVGWAFIGFGLIFYGMHVMGAAVEPIKGDPGTAEILRKVAGSPWMSFVAATILTGIIQSSGATVALAMTLTAQGVIPTAAALPIVIGANVGTCVTALIGAVGAGEEGKRVAATHLGFKLLAALIVMPIVAWGGLGAFLADFSRELGAGPTRTVANTHTIFNCAMVLAFLPICGLLSRFFGRVIPHRASGAEVLGSKMSKALQGSPAAAMLAAESALADMGRRAAAMLADALEVFAEGNRRQIAEIRQRDDELDAIYGAMSRQMPFLFRDAVSREQSIRQSRIVYVAKHLEEVGDLVSREILKIAHKRSEKNVELSLAAIASLRRFGAEALVSLEKIVVAFDNMSQEEALELTLENTETMETDYRRLVIEHFEQVGRGVANAGETGAIYPDALAALRDIRLVSAEICRVTRELQKERSGDN